jgi:hypothetical protein
MIRSDLVRECRPGIGRAASGGTASGPPTKEGLRCYQNGNSPNNERLLPTHCGTASAATSLLLQYIC